MVVNVKETTLWRAEVDNRPGDSGQYTIAKALGDAGINLSFVMAKSWAEGIGRYSASRMRPMQAGPPP